MPRGRGRVAVDGLRGLDRALRELPETVRRDRVVQRALRRAARPIAERAAELAPVDRRPDRDDVVLRDSMLIRGQTRGDTVTVRVGPARDAWYGIVQEHGSADVPAQPFLRPAWDAARGGLVAGIGRDIWAGIRRAARRARRAGGRRK